jgi:hypothetical protein
MPAIVRMRHKRRRRNPYSIDWRGQRPADEAVARRMENPAWGDLVDRITDADRDWFAARPRRKCRLRPIRHDEIPELAGAQNMHVIVFRAAPGVRVRFFVQLGSLLPDDDEILFATFRQGLSVQIPELWRRIEAFMSNPQLAASTGKAGA